MEIKAESHSTVTKDDYIEAVRATAKKWHRNFYLGVAVLLLAGGIYYFAVPNGIYGVFPAILFTLCAVGVALWGLWGYNRSDGKRCYEKALINAGTKTLDKRICFYDDRMTIADGGEGFEIDYSEATRDTVTQNLYMIFLRDNSAVFMRLDSFTVGTKDDVHRLIFEREAPDEEAST